MASSFADLMIDAHRSLLALEGVTERDKPRAAAAAVSGGERVYARLLEYQRSAWLTRAEALALQDALDLLGARLRAFGADGDGCRLPRDL